MRAELVFTRICRDVVGCFGVDIGGQPFQPLLCGWHQAASWWGHPNTTLENVKPEIPASSDFLKEIVPHKIAFTMRTSMMSKAMIMISHDSVLRVSIDLPGGQEALNRRTDSSPSGSSGWTGTWSLGQRVFWLVSCPTPLSLCV